MKFSLLFLLTRNNNLVLGESNNLLNGGRNISASIPVKKIKCQNNEINILKNEKLIMINHIFALQL